KRSTRTVVLPVPAPAETNTSPRASIAASCCSFMPPPAAGCTGTGAGTVSLRQADGSCARHPAHAPHVAPRRALVALRVVRDISRADPACCDAGAFDGGVELCRERVGVEVVPLLEAGQVVARGLAPHSS